METITYTNSKGELININSGNIRTSIKDSKALTYSVTLKGDIKNEGKEFDAICVCVEKATAINLLRVLGGSEGTGRYGEETQSVKNTGKLAVGELYLPVYFTGVKELVYENDAVVKMRLSFFSKRLYWIKEVDCGTLTYGQSLVVRGGVPADFNLRMTESAEGPVSVALNLNGNSYLVGTSYESTPLNVQVWSYNAYTSGIDRDNFFRVNAIPPGTYTVTWEPQAATVKLIVEEQEYLPL